MKIFFNDDKFKDSIITYLKVLDRQTIGNVFEEQRNRYIQLILRQITADGETWDEKTPFNKDYISEALRKRITEANTSKDSLDEMFTMLLRFFIEEYLNNPVNENSLYQDIRDFSLANIESFSKTHLVRSDMLFMR